MNYETIFDQFIEQIPSKKSEIQRYMRDEYAEYDDGPHVLFGIVIVPLVIKWTNAKDSAASDCFRFFEHMAESENDAVSELLDFTILEAFADEESESLSNLKHLMGPQTLEHFAYIEEYIVHPPKE